MKREILSAVMELDREMGTLCVCVCVGGCVPGNSSVPRFVFDMSYIGFCFNPYRYLTRRENSY